jgi:hypothetical protein
MELAVEPSREKVWEVWGYCLFASLLLSMGAGWIFYSLYTPSNPPGNPTIAAFFVPAGSILVALGLLLVWRAELLYRATRAPQS